MSQTPHSLEAFALNDDFIGRHIGPRERDRKIMLETLGVASLDSLIDQVVPRAILSQTPLELGESRTEQDVLSQLREIAEQNKTYKSLIGLGYYNCHTPTVILRNVLENPGWYTAYTPYQPEISQGRLEGRC